MVHCRSKRIGGWRGNRNFLLTFGECVRVRVSFLLHLALKCRGMVGGGGSVGQKKIMRLPAALPQCP